MTDGLILEGDLQDIFLPTLLMSLYRDKETGILSVEAYGFTKTMYIKEGNVVFATSKCPDDRLGESLLRRGKITVKDYVLTSKQIRVGRRLGEILVDMGILTSEEMILGVKDQLIEIIDSILHVTKGHYLLELTDFSTEDMITLSIDMPNLLYQGMKKMKSWRIMYSMVGPLETKLRKVEEIPQFFSSLELNPDEEHILSLLSAPITVDSLLEASYLPQFDTYNILWIFLTLGILYKEAASKKGTLTKQVSFEEIVDEFNDVFSLYFYKLGSKNEEVFKRTFNLLKMTYPNFLEGQSGFYEYGRLDPDDLIVKFRNVDPQKREEILNSFLMEVYYGLSFFAHKELERISLSEIEDHIKKHSAIASALGSKNV
ncbi:MAG: DUF4388 domain-containing protein [Acidobacteria bacterium]|nr:DUF4388 domain-containing protein [Acidobacteriota bacterium]